MTHHLAQFNVATLRFPLDDPRAADFVALLDPVNALADAAPGFVWRLVEDGANDATGLRPAGADVIVNYSVWESAEALWEFAYRSGHLELLRRRREWFARPTEAHSVLWWIPAGHVPTVAEAVERLRLLRADGPSARAFTFAERYTPAGEREEGRPGRRGDSGKDHREDGRDREIGRPRQDDGHGQDDRHRQDGRQEESRAAVWRPEAAAVRK